MSKKLCIRLLSLLMAVCLVLSLGACGSSGDEDVNASTNETVNNSDTAENKEDAADSKEDSTSSDKGTASDKASSSDKTSSADKTTSNKASSTDKTSSADKTTSTIEIDSSKKKTSLSRDEVIAKMPSNLKGTTIKYMYWWNPKNQMEKDAIASFEKATGCKIEPVVASYSDFITQLTAKVAAGDSPDIVRLLGNLTNRTSALQPITNSGFDFNDTFWDSQVMKDYTFNGKVFATNAKNSAIMDYAVIYYNKNALKNAEMEDPYTIWKNTPNEWTWTNFWKMCDEFVKANNNRAGYYGATFEYLDAYVFALNGYATTYNSAKGKYVSGLTNKATIVGWQRTLDAIDKKWLVPSHDVTAFDNAKILFFWSGPYSARTEDARQEALKSQNALGIVPLPTDSKVQNLYEYTAFGIPEGAKNAAAVPYYLRWVLDQNSYDMSKVWYNAEAKEVMDYVASSDKISYNHSYVPGLESDLKKGGSKQVESVLNSYTNVVNALIEDENKTISYYE